jgi:hypothetical protein
LILYIRFAFKGIQESRARIVAKSNLKSKLKPVSNGVGQTSFRFSIDSVLRIGRELNGNRLENRSSQTALTSPNENISPSRESDHGTVWDFRTLYSFLRSFRPVRLRSVAPSTFYSESRSLAFSGTWRRSDPHSIMLGHFILHWLEGSRHIRDSSQVWGLVEFPHGAAASIPSGFSLSHSDLPHPANSSFTVSYPQRSQDLQLPFLFVILRTH